jgi:hypothetical protein
MMDCDDRASTTGQARRRRARMPADGKVDCIWKQAVAASRRGWLR